MELAISPVMKVKPLLTRGELVKLFETTKTKFLKVPRAVRFWGGMILLNVVAYFVFERPHEFDGSLEVHSMRWLLSMVIGMPVYMACATFLILWLWGDPVKD